MEHKSNDVTKKTMGTSANNDMMVSVCCITYNHKQFIGQAIDGFLMQKTNFQFEIIIGDDYSTDGAADVIKAYAEQYPNMIKFFQGKKNVGAHNNIRNVVKHCAGKYIALCDGDDYWTDPYKLQKQVDFLEQNPDYVICCHYTRVIDSNYNTLHVDLNPVPLVHTYQDLLIGKQTETKTATVVYHNIPEVNQIFDKPWYLDIFAVDKLFKIFATYITGRKIYVMPEVMSCYRNHVGGIWSMIKTNARKEMVISDFNLIIRKFSYRGLQKRKLLQLYLKRDILFEIQRFRMRKIYNTLKYLV